jgi:hypothetical protein
VATTQMLKTWMKASIRHAAIASEEREPPPIYTDVYLE